MNKAFADAAPPAASPSPSPTVVPSKPPKSGGLGSALKVSALTLGSRVLGLVREQLFAALIGAGFYADAFVAAFRIPNLLRDLFAEGALSAAFVPTFSKVEVDHGLQAAYQLANKVIGALLLLVGLITLLGIVFARPLVWALAPGFAQYPGKLELTAFLAQVMMPFLLVLSLAAVTMGMLNARGRFSMPALAPALFNVAAIGVGVVLKILGASPTQAVVGWSIGTLLGGAVQFGVQLPTLWRDGFRLVPQFTGLWRDQSIRRIARLMAPATVGLAATQINIFINTQFASDQAGAISWLNYAFRLMYLPIGIFGVAIATVTASNLARRAASRDLAGVRAELSRGLRHVAFLTVPSTVGLCVLAQPIIGLIYQHGRFSATDTQATAYALLGYAFGLYAYSGVKVAAPAFYALEKSKIPLIASASAVATNLTLNCLAHKYLGYFGLALGTSLGAVVNLAILSIAFRRLTSEVEAPKGLFNQLAKVVLASATMGGLVWAALAAFDAFKPKTFWQVTGTGYFLTRTAVGIGLGVAVYVLACRALKIGEMNEMLAMLRRRRRAA